MGRWTGKQRGGQAECFHLVQQGAGRAPAFITTRSQSRPAFRFLCIFFIFITFFEGVSLAQTLASSGVLCPCNSVDTSQPLSRASNSVWGSADLLWRLAREAKFAHVSP